MFYMLCKTTGNQCRNIQNMAANYCRAIKQQAEELKHVTVFITKLAFDQNADNVRGTLHSAQRGVWSHCKAYLSYTW